LWIRPTLSTPQGTADFDRNQVGADMTLENVLSSVASEN
jgi:hypothetical protein